MKFKRSKILVTLMLTVALFIVSCIPASAYTVYSSTWKYATGIQNYSYRFRSLLGIYPGGLYATAHIETTNGRPMTPLWVEETAFLYKSNGVLKKSSGMCKLYYYSSSFKYDVSTTDSGTYYATGWFGLANDQDATSYTIYYGSNTTNVYYSGNAVSNLVSDAPEGYAVNSKGETYGSGILAEVYNEAPDLIEAEGVNGNVGYIRYDEFISTPADEADSIPVYDLDGNVIDTFEFSASVVDDGELVPADPTPIEPIV